MVKTTKIPKLIALLVLFCTMNPVFAGTIKHQDLNQLKTQAAEYITSQIDRLLRKDFSVTIRALDTRLKLAKCEHAIEFSLSGKQRQIRRNGTVRAACTQPQPWQVFIPYQAVQLTQVLVTIRDIEKGEQLTAQDVRVEKQDRFQTRNASYTDISQVVGTHAKTALRRGEVINARNLCSVCREQPVTIYAIGSGLRLKTDGTALEDGIPGQIIRVKNTRSGRTIKAKVVNAGRVEVNI